MRAIAQKGECSLFFDENGKKVLTKEESWRMLIKLLFGSGDREKKTSETMKKVVDKWFEMRYTK